MRCGPRLPNPINSLSAVKLPFAGRATYLLKEVESLSVCGTWHGACVSTTLRFYGN